MKCLDQARRGHNLLDSVKSEKGDFQDDSRAWGRSEYRACTIIAQGTAPQS